MHGIYIQYSIYGTITVNVSVAIFNMPCAPLPNIILQNKDKIQETKIYKIFLIRLLLKTLVL